MRTLRPTPPFHLRLIDIPERVFGKVVRKSQLHLSREPESLRPLHPIPPVSRYCYFLLGYKLQEGNGWGVIKKSRRTVRGGQENEKFSYERVKRKIFFFLHIADLTHIRRVKLRGCFLLSGEGLVEVFPLRISYLRALFSNCKNIYSYYLIVNLLKNNVFLLKRHFFRYICSSKRMAARNFYTILPIF